MSVSGEGWLGFVVSRGSEEGKGREAKGGLIGAGWRRGAKNLAERIVAGDFGSLLGAEDEEGPRAGEEGHQGRVGAEQHTHTGGGARSGFFPQPAVRDFHPERFHPERDFHQVDHLRHARPGGPAAPGTK